MHKKWWQITTVGAHALSPALIIAVHTPLVSNAWRYSHYKLVLLTFYIIQNTSNSHSLCPSDAPPEMTSVILTWHCDSEVEIASRPRRDSWDTHSVFRWIKIERHAHCATIIDRIALKMRRKRRINCNGRESGRFREHTPALPTIVNNKDGC